jgi:phosphatidylserine decarboxylase
MDSHQPRSSLKTTAHTASQNKASDDVDLLQDFKRFIESDGKMLMGFREMIPYSHSTTESLP